MISKEELLTYSASEVRSNRALYAEFVNLYTQDGGDKKKCIPCNFLTTFNRWRQENAPKKNNIMSAKINTFKLKKHIQAIYVPSNGEVITDKKATDELAIEYLTQSNNKFFAQRSLSFEVLPKALIEEENSSPIVSDIEPKIAKRRKKNK